MYGAMSSAVYYEDNKPTAEDIAPYYPKLSSEAHQAMIDIQDGLNALIAAFENQLDQAG